MAVIPGSVRVAGFIAPTDSTDTYAVHDDAYGRGGWRTVADIAARNAITADRRKLGMAVRVLDDGYGVQKNYTLLSGLNDINWVEDSIGNNSINVDTTYYVDGDNGNDAYTGLSWDTAKKTMAFLYSGDGYAIPREINADVNVLVRGTVLSANDQYHTIITNFYGTGSLTITGQTTDVVTDLTPTGWDNNINTSVEGTTYLEASGSTWTTDEYQGNFIQITTPAGTTLYPIQSNTSMRLETMALPVDISESTRFKIVRVPSFKGAQVSASSVLISNYPGSPTSKSIILINNNVIPIALSRVRVTDHHASIYCPFVFGSSAETSGSSYVDNAMIHIAESVFNGTPMQYSGIGNVRNTLTLLSTISDGWYVSEQAYLYFAMCCFVCTSVSKVGNSCWGAQNSKITDNMCRHTHVANAYYIRSCHLEFDGVLFEDCAPIYANSATASTYARPTIGVVKFKNCDECIRLISLALTVDWDDASFIIDNCVREIVLADDGNGNYVTATFADVLAHKAISNTANGACIVYNNQNNNYGQPYSLPEYNNTTSGLDAYSYQDAIDLLAISTGGSEKTIFSELSIPLIDAYDFILTELVAATDEAIVYLFESIPTVGYGFVIISFYKDFARTQKVHEISIDLADATTWSSSEAFGIQMDTTGTVYGRINCSELDPGSMIDISLYANSISPTTTPIPMPGPYGFGLEDNGFGDPQIALAANSGLEFYSGKLRIKSDVTTPATVVMGVGGTSVIGVVNLTTDQNIAGQKAFDSVGLIPMDNYGSPVGGSWTEGIEVLDGYGVKWRRFQNTWELADVVTEYPEVIAGTTLAYGGTELFKIPVTGDVGQCLWLRVWARRATGTAEIQIPFRARIYETTDKRGREMVWQGLGLARQTYITLSVPASQTYLVVNSNDIIDVDELVCVYESDSRFEIGRCSARPSGEITLSEAMVDSNTWNVNTLALAVTEWWNVPWINRDGSATNQKHILLEIRHDGISTDASLVFYVQVLAQNRGLIR